jgi:mono/diheme cytochrome c family protein
VIGRSRYLIALLFVAAGCDLPGRPRPADRPVPPDQVLDFAALYGQNCAGCHGAEGQFGPAPPLNNALFLKIVPESVLQSVIAEGRPGTPMPAFAQSRGGPLTAAQVKVLAEGIKPRWNASGQAGSAEPPPYTGETQGVPKRGAQVFERACAGCHGSQGEGDEAGAIHDRSFLALMSDQVLRRYAITGRPDLGMPDFATKKGRGDSFQPLAATEVDDLVALFARWREGGSADTP